MSHDGARRNWLRQVSATGGYVALEGLGGLTRRAQSADFCVASAAGDALAGAAHAPVLVRQGSNL